MRGRFILCAVGALLIAAPPAMAETGDQPPAAKTVKAKKKRAPTVRHAPPPEPARKTGEMTPGTGPALLRGVKDDNM